MILFDRVTHYARDNKPMILDEVSLALPTDRRIALLGLRGSGRSSVIRLVNGLTPPRHGTVIRPARVSFTIGGPPVAVSPKLTVAQYVQDIARLYGAIYREVIDFMVEWGDAEPLLKRLMGKLTNVERSQIMLPLAYALPFSFYVVDGDPLGAAPKFRDKFRELLKQRIGESGVLYAAPKPHLAAALCDSAVILHDGDLVFFDSITEAMEIFESELAPLEKPKPEEVDEDDLARVDPRTRELSEAPEAGVFF
ncbi:MAG: ATP-binding cassette domain-containing protein [Rhodobacteraceae bacterium]|nr:ATP-binding cassette domain-containing protein [Paracoccaceae bacterium]